MMAGSGKAWRKKRKVETKEEAKKKEEPKEELTEEATKREPEPEKKEEKKEEELQEEPKKEEPKKKEPKKKTKPKKEEPKKEEPKKKTGLLLVVNLHGQINVRRKVRAALRELQIDRRFSATVVRDEPSTVGLLDLSRDYVAWAPLEEELLASLLKSRAKVSERRRLDSDAIAKLGFKGTEELASKMMNDEMRLSAVKGLRPFFNLSPPRGGFKVSTRRKYGEGGVLGLNPELSELVRRMI